MHPFRYQGRKFNYTKLFFYFSFHGHIFPCKFFFKAEGQWEDDGVVFIEKTLESREVDWEMMEMMGSVKLRDWVNFELVISI